MINERRIILCLDIDQTIMSHSCPVGVFDFNGSTHYGDASAWVNFLTEMKTYCEERSIEFFVQIISAKEGVDSLVRQVFKELHPFLFPLNKQGKIIGPFVNPIQGYFPSHPTGLYYMQHHHMVKQWESTRDCVTYVTSDQALLPPIHLCKYNLINKDKLSFFEDKSYSKAFVMKYIAAHFDDITPAENMFLLDDNPANIHDIQQPHYGYQGVLAEELCLLEAGTKAERTAACHKILATLKDKIKKRVDFICGYDVRKEGQNGSRLPSDRPGIQGLASISKATNGQPHKIHLAVKANNFQRIKELAERDPSLIHVVDAYNQTPLLWAAFKGHHKIVAFLIEKGAQVNQATQLPENGSYQKNHNNTPLDWAIIGAHFKAIYALLKAGAVSNNHSDNDLLRLMIEANNITQVQAIIVRNKLFLNQVDNVGYAPLHYAAFFGRLDIALYLIGEGADLNIFTQTTSKGKNIKIPNQTAIDIARDRMNESMVILLLEAGAIPIPVLEKRKQAIHIFAQHGLLNNLKTLIELCPKWNTALNQLSDDGYAPLHYAAIYGHIEIIHFLIASGADINITTAPVISGNYSKVRHHQMTAMKLWALCHPLQKNPFDRYCREQDLEKRKTQIVALIARKASVTILGLYANLTNRNTILKDLERRILRASFKPTDSVDKTADDVLIEIIDVCEREWEMKGDSFFSRASKPNMFFSLSKSQPNSTLQAVRSLLRSSSKNNQNRASGSIEYVSSSLAP